MNSFPQIKDRIVISMRLAFMAGLIVVFLYYVAAFVSLDDRPIIYLLERYSSEIRLLLACLINPLALAVVIMSVFISVWRSLFDLSLGILALFLAFYQVAMCLFTIPLGAIHERNLAHRYENERHYYFTDRYSTGWGDGCYYCDSIRVYECDSLSLFCQSEYIRLDGLVFPDPPLLIHEHPNGHWILTSKDGQTRASYNPSSTEDAVE